MPRSLDEVREAKRLGMARLRAKDPVAARRKQKAWCDANRQHVRTKVREYHQRRFFWKIARRLASENAATTKEVARLWKLQRGLCALTGERLTRETAELDHKLPKARGGSDRLDNLQWVTHKANFAKRDLTDAEFYILCSNVMRWIGTRIEMVEAITPL